MVIFSSSLDDPRKGEYGGVIKKGGGKTWEFIRFKSEGFRNPIGLVDISGTWRIIPVDVSGFLTPIYKP